MAKCRLCKKDIEEGARVCPVCRYSQSRWRNGLPYLSGIVALLTIIASGVVYIHSRWNDIRSEWLGRPELRLISFDSNDELCFLNSGDRDLFVYYVVFETADPASKLFVPVNKVAKQSEMVLFRAVDNPEVHMKKFWTVGDGLAQFFKKYFCGPPPADASPPKPAGGSSKLPSEFRCIWYSENHPEFMGYMQYDPTHAWIEGTATVVFYDTSDYSRLTLKMNCSALVVQEADKDGNPPQIPEDIWREVMGTKAAMPIPSGVPESPLSSPPNARRYDPL